MKLILSIILLLSVGIYNQTEAQYQRVAVSTFKKVPDDFTGCGDSYYLSERDKKHGEFVCITNYVFALMYVDNKEIRFKANEKISHNKNEQIYVSGKYKLSLKKTYVRNEGDEDYVFKGIITVKLDDHLVYQKQIIGEGGC